MTNIKLQLNSLRLHKVFGDGDFYHDLHPEWFYNGSVKFEEKDDNPKVFASLAGAISYFTSKLPRCQRTIGQFVTYAEGTSKNWFLYVYVGPNTSDESYSNPKNWLLFGEARKIPYTEVQESIDSEKQYKEVLKLAKTLNEQIEN